ncbi:MAG: CAAX farnesyltransferase (FTase) subunit beta [Pycnora praestabilis]|nr:MAG: CAAX farnesyltransferase (FTase) subunit beta [Pycnora praestabilis]
MASPESQQEIRKQSPLDRWDELLSRTTPLKEEDFEAEIGTGAYNDADEAIRSEDDIEFLFPRDRQMPSQDGPLVPDLFTSLPPIRDLLSTESSKLQDYTIQECRPFLSGTDEPRGSIFDYNEHGIPKLEREKHITFLHGSLGELPAGFVAADASRPWMLYWALTGLCLLGEDVTKYRQSVISTLKPMQNSNGGFGGGHGQMSHCASSYAAVLSLFIVGGDEALSLINRQSMWKWLGDVKQRDGGFQVCVGGEEDVRGAYCSMVIISLLNLPLDLPASSSARVNQHDTFVSGLPEYLSRCQTFEGGIAGSPGTEAHGAYAFCALACLCIIGEPHEMIPRYLDMHPLIAWLSARQYAPEGGFSGRVNKLVDGCYSFWVGGCWPLVEAALNGTRTVNSFRTSLVGSLYNREGLQRYILCCCQDKRGGLKDKPRKHPDPYHSCYVLAGLSSAQHAYYYAEFDHSQSSAALPSALHWAYSNTILSSMGEEEEHVCEEDDRVNVIHPIYVLPWSVAERSRAWYESKVDFLS